MDKKKNYISKLEYLEVTFSAMQYKNAVFTVYVCLD